MTIRLVDALRDVNKSFRKKDIAALRSMSEIYTREAIVNDNRELMTLSIISYALAKILEKTHYTQSERWNKFLRNASNNLANAVGAVNSGKQADVKSILNNMIKDIDLLDEEMKRFTTKLIDKTRVKKAAQIYGQGFSLGKAADLAGIDKQKVLSYVGITMAHEFEKFRTLSIEQRLEYARAVFK